MTTAARLRSDGCRDRSGTGRASLHGWGVFNFWFYDRFLERDRPVGRAPVTHLVGTRELFDGRERRHARQAVCPSVNAESPYARRARDVRGRCRSLTPDPDVGGRGCWRRPLSRRETSALTRQIVSRLGAGIVDAYLKHRKTALQFERSVLCAFLGAELGLQSSIYFEGETGFRQFDRSAGHSESVVGGGRVRIWLR